VKPATPLQTHLQTHLDSLREAVAAAGLGDQVRVGVPQPIHPPAGRGESRFALTPAGEGALDSLLGISSHPERPGSAEPLGSGTGGHSRWAGGLIELSGAPSSGQTALAYRLALGATTRGEWVGWVDLPDALDPPSLERAGVRLESLLWVRPRELAAAFRSAELLLKTGFAVVALDLEGAPAQGLARLGASIWTRLLRAARGSRGTAVLLGAERAAGSFSSLALYTERSRAHFEAGLFEGLESTASVLRNRYGPTDLHLPLLARAGPSGLSAGTARLPAPSRLSSRAAG
jgi:hypothetical protein